MRIMDLGGDSMDLDKYYSEFEEKGRLFHSQASSVEFYTTMSRFEKWITLGSEILELGAASGAYTLALANKGYRMVALDIVKKHVDELKIQASGMQNVCVYHQDASDLSMFKDEQFSTVLCMGPMYHILDEQIRKKCLKHSLRVLQKNGLLFVAFINNNACFATESFYDHGVWLNTKKLYDPQTFHLRDDPFVFHTIEEMKQVFENEQVDIVEMFAQDGIAELLYESINKFSKEAFHEWLTFHKKTCTQKEMLGYSNHIMVVLRKR